MAKIYLKGSSDKTLILGVREGLLYPFSAPGWTDLRLSAWLSLTSTTSDDDVTGIAETLSYSTPRDRFYFGIKDNSSTFPANSGSLFCGIATHAATGGTIATPSGSTIVAGGNTDATIIDGATAQSAVNFGSLIMPGPASTPYAALVIAKLTRSSGSLSITPIVQEYTTAGAFTSTPDIPSARSMTASGSPASTTGTAGTVSAAPTCVFIYWPFNNSRLRIHSLVLEKYAP